MASLHALSPPQSLTTCEWLGKITEPLTGTFADVRFIPPPHPLPLPTWGGWKDKADIYWVEKWFLLLLIGNIRLGTQFLRHWHCSFSSCYQEAALLLGGSAEVLRGGGGAIRHHVGLLQGLPQVFGACYRGQEDITWDQPRHDTSVQYKLIEYNVCIAKCYYVLKGYVKQNQVNT